MCDMNTHETNVEDQAKADCEELLEDYVESINEEYKDRASELSQKLKVIRLKYIELYVEISSGWRKSQFSDQSIREADIHVYDEVDLILKQLENI